MEIDWERHIVSTVDLTLISSLNTHVNIRTYIHVSMDMHLHTPATTTEYDMKKDA